MAVKSCYSTRDSILLKYDQVIVFKRRIWGELGKKTRGAVVRIIFIKNRQVWTRQPLCSRQREFLFCRDYEPARNRRTRSDRFACRISPRSTLACSKRSDSRTRPKSWRGKQSRGNYSRFFPSFSRHQYGISALVSQTSFRGETSDNIVKCRLFSQAKKRD